MTNGTGVEGHRPARFKLWMDINTYVSPPGLTPSKPINSNPRISLLAPGVYCVTDPYYFTAGFADTEKLLAAKRKLTNPKVGQLTKKLSFY